MSRLLLTCRQRLISRFLKSCLINWFLSLLRFLLPLCVRACSSPCFLPLLAHLYHLIRFLIAMLKKRLLLSSALIVSTLCAASFAHAQTSRIYLAGYLGLNTFNDQEFTESSTASSGEMELDNSTSFAGAIGLRLSRNMRLEGELSYRNAEFKTIDLAGTGTFNNGGELKSTFAFLNSLLRFRCAMESAAFHRRWYRVWLA